MAHVCCRSHSIVPEFLANEKGTADRWSNFLKTNVENPKSSAKMGCKDPSFSHFLGQIPQGIPMILALNHVKYPIPKSLGFPTPNLPMKSPFWAPDGCVDQQYRGQHHHKHHLPRGHKLGHLSLEKSGFAWGFV